MKKTRSPKTVQIPSNVNDAEVAEAVQRLREYDSQAAGYWRGVARSIEDLNARVAADRQRRLPAA